MRVPPLIFGAATYPEKRPSRLWGSFDYCSLIGVYSFRCISRGGGGGSLSEGRGGPWRCKGGLVGKGENSKGWGKGGWGDRIERGGGDRGKGWIATE